MAQKAGFPEGVLWAETGMKVGGAREGKEEGEQQGEGDGGAWLRTVVKEKKVGGDDWVTGVIDQR